MVRGSGIVARPHSVLPFVYLLQLYKEFLTLFGVGNVLRHPVLQIFQRSAFDLKATRFTSRMAIGPT